MTLPILLSFLGRHFGKTPAVGVVSTLSWSMRIDILVSSPWIQERRCFLGFLFVNIFLQDLGEFSVKKGP